MKPKDLLTKEFLTEQCIELGKSGYQIAKENNLNVMTVYNYIKKYGIDKPTDKFDNLELDKDFNQGLSIQEISNKHKISYTAVYNRVRHLIKKNTDLLTYEVLYEDRVINEMILKDIAKKYGVSEPSVRKKCKEYGIDHNRKDIRKRLTKEIFYKMYYEENKSLTEIASEFNTVYQGTILELMKEWGFKSRTDRRTKSQIEAYKRSKFHPEICGAYMTKIKDGAKKRPKNIKVEITLDDIWSQYLKQEKKCAISGVDIYFAKTNEELSLRLATASVDRIDSNLHYTTDNIQIVHKTVNVIKWDLSQQEFIDWCKIICLNNKD